MKTKNSTKVTKRTYTDVIRLMKDNKIDNPTWSETWLYGSYKYYQKKIETKLDVENLEIWWKGVIKSYNQKNGIK